MAKVPALYRLAGWYLLRLMWPEQVGGIAMRAQAWPTGARTVRELPHVVERAVARATGPMLDPPGVWLSSLHASLPPRGPGMPRGRSAALGGAVQHLLTAHASSPFTGTA
jgi:hypothetical protein